MKQYSMLVTQDLGLIWRILVEQGAITFDTRDKRGHRIRVRLVYLGGEIGFTGTDLENGETVTEEVLERPIFHSRFAILYNGYRALRPNVGTIVSGRQPDKNADPRECAFRCMEPSHEISLHRRNPIIVQQANGPWVPYANLVPFETRGHVVWVRVSQNGSTLSIPHLPQELGAAEVEDFLGLLAQSRHMAIFFNANHAGASVPHLHFQSVYMASPFAIEYARFEQHHGHWCLEDYPAAGLVYPARVKSAMLYADIAKLRDAGIPYNLIGIGSHVFLIGRDINNEVVADFPSGFIASMELAGRVVTADRDVYRTMTFRRLSRAIRATTLSRSAILGVVGKRSTALRLAS